MKTSLQKFTWIIFSLCSLRSVAQNSAVRLKQRSFIPEGNVASVNFDSLQQQAGAAGKLFLVLQFEGAADEQKKQELARARVELYHYIPEHAYTAVLAMPVNGAALKRAGVRAVFQLQPQDKLSSTLLKNRVPFWAVHDQFVHLVVHFSSGISPSFAREYFAGRSFTVVDNSWQQYGFFTLSLEPSRITELATVPFVEYIEPIAPTPKTLNYAMRANTRANVLNAPASTGGAGLSGAGVTIGVGDDGDPSDHVDLRDRLVNHAAAPLQVHATHVAGIAAGGGIKDPQFQGVAPLATVIAQLFNGIFLNAAAYIADYHMVVTNNSWGNITGECDLAGVYDTYSKLMDDLSIQYPYLLHVFAAGNDGPYTCLGYPKQYHTVVSGHQSAKNVLTVGWGEKNQTVSPASSIGPVADGRLKPEICSQGSGLRSTAPGDDYFTDWGTSMAAPSVTGGAALLIEQYRKMHAGADPKGGLVKALLMNGARDIENPAPDFKSGYGYLNLVRSLDILQQDHILNGTISTGGTVNHTVVIPAGIAQLKVMVYWHDPAAAIFAEQALVNDLDLEVETPGAEKIFPWVLQPDSASAIKNAVRGTDHRNNSEQVTIDNPAAGQYTVRIKGNAVNTGGAQEYFVVYDLVPDTVDLTYPSAGEPLVPGETIVVNWDAWGQQNSFALDYSVDNGLNWINIDANIPAGLRQYQWTVPNLATAQARMRLRRNGSGLTDISHAFAILGQPSVNAATVQCRGYINLQWNTVPGATEYEVMMKKGAEMKTVAATTANNYLFTGLNPDTVYWVTVRAKINGVEGRRAVAISRRPDTGTCSGSISDNDLESDTVIAPSSGRLFTSTAITGNSVTLRIRNLDDNPVPGFIAGYRLNGGSFVYDTVNTTIAALGTYDHSFTGIDFSNPGDYAFTFVVKNNSADPVSANDTLLHVISQLPNSPVTLPVTETFENTPVFEQVGPATGLPGADRWDFTSSTRYGRIRSFVHSGMAKSGVRAMTLDAKQYIPNGNTNFLTATFNLSAYNSIPAADLGLILRFSYKHHGQSPHQNNRVWVRGSDTDSWIEVFSFDSIAIPPGEWKMISVQLANIVPAIQHSSSFQVRFGQHGMLPAGDNISGNGITIDDVQLFSAPNDVAMTGVDFPIQHGCDIGAEVPVTIRYTLQKSSLSCLPVYYRINNGPAVTGCAPAVSGTYTFDQPVKLPGGANLLETWVAGPSDTYKQNDTIGITVYRKPVITVYPHIENFENGPGGWHTEGHNTSWEYGMPASLRINTAASGTKAWKTKLKGQYNENEESYLYSPCYDISGL
ncbi:MAG TPA: S8 family serine peptidase, partial [Chitinophagaceae bacterium]